MNSGVYCILNVQTGMGYVGSSANLAYRAEQHFHNLELGKHHNTYLQAAFLNCGDVWAWIILEECAEPDLQHTEQKWINRRDRLNKLYNIDKIAERK